mgnify:CR=1 FL=1
MQSEIDDIISLDDYDIFSVNFKLTKNGLENVQEVYSYVINYMDYFKKKIINKDEYLKKIYNEYIQTNKNNFKYWEATDITEIIIILSHLMQEDFPKEYLLNFDTMFPNYEDFCNNCLEILNDYIPIRTGGKNSEVLFLQMMINNLNINGRCATVMLDGEKMYGSTSGYDKAREYLMKSCDLHEVILCPAGTFTSTSSKTCILFFTKKKFIFEKIGYFLIKS